MRFYMLVMLALIMMLCMIWGAGEMDAAQAQTIPEEDGTVQVSGESSVYQFGASDPIIVDADCFG